MPVQKTVHAFGPLATLTTVRAKDLQLHDVTSEMIAFGVMCDRDLEIPCRDWTHLVHVSLGRGHGLIVLRIHDLDPRVLVMGRLDLIAVIAMVIVIGLQADRIDRLLLLQVHHQPDRQIGAPPVTVRTGRLAVHGQLCCQSTKHPAGRDRLLSRQADRTCRVKYFAGGNGMFVSYENIARHNGRSIDTAGHLCLLAGQGHETHGLDGDLALAGPNADQLTDVI